MGVVDHAADSDRRHHQRVDVQLDVELETAGAEAVVAGRSVNVSEGGVRLRAGQPVERGELVYLVLGTSDRIVATVGEVLSSSTVPDSGLVDVRVRFRELSDRRRVGLDRILQEASG